MKYLKTMISAMMTIVVMTACCGSNNDEPDYVIYRHDVMLSAAQSDTIVWLGALDAAISSIEGGDTWLVVTEHDFLSGSPSVRLTATANESESQRSSTVTITAKNADRLLLVVTQEEGLAVTGVDDAHDIVTDQPASSRGVP